MSDTPEMRCRHCGRPMFLELRSADDAVFGQGPEEWWHCPARLDGKHGEWHSMPVIVTRVPDAAFNEICAALSRTDGEDNPNG